MSEIITKRAINGFEVPGGTDKGTDHSYLNSYEVLLSPYRESSCTLLEIGVKFGGSALLWHDYLPKSTLFLVDIEDAIAPNVRSCLNPERYSLSILDAYTKQALNAMQKKNPQGYDVIIDDGDHRIASQEFVLSHYSKLLKEGGILVIEDIQNNADLNRLKSLASRLPDLRTEIIDLRTQKNRYDDLLFVARRISSKEAL